MVKRLSNPFDLLVSCISLLYAFLLNQNFQFQSGGSTSRDNVNYI